MGPHDRAWRRLAAGLSVTALGYSVLVIVQSQPLADLALGLASAVLFAAIALGVPLLGRTRAALAARQARCQAKSPAPPDLRADAIQGEVLPKPRWPR